MLSWARDLLIIYSIVNTFANMTYCFIKSGQATEDEQFKWDLRLASFIPVILLLGNI